MSLRATIWHGSAVPAPKAPSSTSAAIDLRGSPASLASMCLTMVKGIGTIFYGMNLEGIQLQAAQLEDSDLRTCKLKNADLRGVNLKRAKLNNADMSGVNLRPLMIDDKRAMRSDLEGAKLRYVNLSGACLRGVNFAGADLSFATLLGADMTKTDFRHAKLFGARVERDALQTANVEGAAGLKL